MKSRIGATVLALGLSLPLLAGCTELAVALPAPPPVADSSAPPYEREEFGDGWSDLDRDRCDTRQEMLARDLVDETFAGDGCKVLTGTLHDPYTGTTIAFRRGPSTSDDVQIDHVVPLAYAWRAGAWAWTPEQREAFANDPANLRAVDGPTNNAKRDRGPARWMPPNPGADCEYAAAWVEVLGAYRLTAEPADAAVLDDVTASCPV